MAAAVRNVAPNLSALGVFIWDGEEMPLYDDMWFALRVWYVHRCLLIGILVYAVRLLILAVHDYASYLLPLESIYWTSIAMSVPHLMLSRTL